MSNEKRFWDKIVKTKRGCWEWRAAIRNKYGVFRYKEKVQYAHRVSWQMHFGEIPEDIYVLHKCDNPKCVNPSHLFLGTQFDNIQDMMRKDRHAKVLKNTINMRGIKNHQAKLSDKMIVQIKDLLKYGLSQREISEFFEVSKSLIGKIGRKEIWTHI